MTAKAKVDLDIRGDRYKEFTAVLKELIGYEGTLKLDEKEEQLAQKFASSFPTATSNRTVSLLFLSQDVTLIRQDYIQTFSHLHPERKKRTKLVSAPAVCRHARGLRSAPASGTEMVVHPASDTPITHIANYDTLGDTAASPEGRL